MLATMAMPPSEADIEKFRVQELLRYYQPPADDSEWNVPSTDDAATPEVDAIQDDSVKVVKLAHDPVLTAFAQLGACRTNCDRSFISLMDHTTQFIVAEGTKSVSLLSPDVHDEGDGLYLGAKAIDLCWGLCPQTIKVFSTSDGRLDENTDNIIGNANQYIIRDLTKEAKFVERPYVAGWPHMRSYAEVPIRTATGYTIGSFCVVDTKSRREDEDKIVTILREIASAIMTHLELVKSQQDHKRAERMIKGLGLFVEGKSSLRDWYLTNPESATVQHSQRTMTAEERVHIEFGPGHAVKSPLIGSDLKSTWPSTTVNEIKDGTTVGVSSIAGLMTEDTEILVESLTTTDIVIDKDGAGAETTTHTVLVDEKTDIPPEKTPRNYSAAQLLQSNELLAFLGREDLFSRASNLIRESLGVEGAVFLDASLYENESDKYNNSDLGSVSDVAATAGDSYETWKRAQQEPEPKCSVLGYSTRTSSSLSGVAGASPFDGMSKASLRYLLSQHARGHVINFSASNKENGLPADLPTGNTVLEDLQRIFVDSKSLAFYPLWDADRQRWYAVCIVWITDEFQEPQMPGHLNYLVSFGNSVMAEKARFDTLASERAKSDFISSISHELRSPLHGVLACSAFLEETARNSADADLIRTIQVCSNTLLDTMDHLLEFSKVKRTLGNHMNKHQPGQMKTSEHANLVHTDLRILVEDVVEAVLVGRAYTAMPGLAKDEPPVLRRVETQTSFDSFAVTSTSGENLSTMKTHGSLIILLTIEWLPSWTFEIPLGAWKRILLNLFGNSLKYTSKGYIEVSLGFSPMPESSSGAPQLEATLSVTDSGKGISEDFLNHNLFTPFLQEDPLAPGTGLGLSIVKQIVKSLNGTITVESEKGLGTTVTVKAPLALPPETLSLNSFHANPFAAIQERTQGNKLSLIAAEVYPEMIDFSQGSAEARSMIVLRKGLSLLASTWFGMEVSIVPSSELAEEGICILTETTFRKSYDLGLRGPTMERQVLIVLTSNDCITQHSFPGTGPGVCFLSQPIGPRKLGKELSHALDYLESLDKLGLSYPPTASSSKEFEEKGMFSTTAIDIIPTPGVEDIKTPIQPFSPPASESDTRSERSSSIGAERPVWSSRPKLAGKPERVLLVEDNPINLKILVTSLEKLKISYGTAVNGLEALKLYEETKGNFDVVLTDISMPVMDGLTSTRKIRAYEKQNSVIPAKIIALTGLSSADVREEAMLSGVDSFLTKPASMKKLQQLLISEA